MKSALKKPTSRKALEAPPQTPTLPSEQVKSSPSLGKEKLQLSLDSNIKHQMKTVAATLKRDVSDILNEAFQVWVDHIRDERIEKLKHAGIL